MNLRLEAEEWLIQEQQKSLDELTTLFLKILENLQKNSKDKMKKSSNELPRNNGDTTKGSGEEPSSGKEEDFNFIIDSHAENMQRFRISWKP